ncbi:MAG: hypothetical protein WCA37_04285 [Terracidiphilus sp.]
MAVMEAMGAAGFAVPREKAKKGESRWGKNMQGNCGKVQINLGGWVFILWWYGPGTSLTDGIGPRLDSATERTGMAVVMGWQVNARLVGMA